MITFKHKGSFKNTERFFNNAKKMNVRAILEKYGSAGVSELSKATPIDTGLTATSWGYKIEEYSGGFKVTWFNTNVQDGVVVAILIQYGHGTGTGGYVPPIDYVNPAMKPIFDKIVEDIWKEVRSL